jgi:hypothetical protein
MKIDLYSGRAYVVLNVINPDHPILLDLHFQIH